LSLHNSVLKLFNSDGFSVTFVGIRSVAISSLIQYLVEASDMNETLYSIRQRRSVRAFSDEDIPNDVLEEILDCARWAPSDTNAQPWRWYVIKNRTLLEAIYLAVFDEMDHVSCEFSEKLEDKSSEYYASYRKAELVLRSFQNYAAVPIGNCTVLAIACAAPYTSKFTSECFRYIFNVETLRDMGKLEAQKSTMMSVQNLLLAAYSLGIGAVPMSGPIYFGERRIRELINIPQEQDVSCVVAMGYPKSQHHPTIARRELSESVTWIL